MIAFVIYAIMNLYHDIVMDQYVLNEAILQKDAERLEEDFSKKTADLTVETGPG